MTERLMGVALQRDGKTHFMTTGSHGELRRSIDRSDPYGDPRPSDVCGFHTTYRAFVTRRQALEVGLASGQLPPQYRGLGRDLLSSDVDWNGRNKA